MKIPAKLLIIGVAGVLAVAVITPVLARGGGDRGPTNRPAAGAPNRPGPARGLFAEVAKALNMKPEELMAQLKAGKTLKQVIEGQGSTVAKVVDALYADLKTGLDAAVKAGRLTQAREDQQLATFKDRTTKSIENAGAIKPPAGHPKGPHAKPGPRPGGPGFGGSGGIGGLLQSVAKDLNVDTAAFRQALKDGKTIKQALEAQGKTEDAAIAAVVAKAKARLDAAVKAGKLTPAQEDQELAAFKDRVKKFIESPRPPAPAGRPGQGIVLRGVGDVIKGTADALKMDPKDLLAQLKAGKTLLQIIKDKGSTEDAVVSAIVATAKAKLDAAVKAGTITQAREDQFLANLKDRLKKAIESPRPTPPFGRDGRGPNGPAPNTPKPTATPAKA